MTLPDDWELAVVAAKILMLAAIAGVGGSCLMLWLFRLTSFPLQPLLRYAQAAAALGLLAVPLWLLLQVGSINQGGLAGMFDMTMAALLLQSTLGWVAALRIGACVLVLVAVSTLRAAGRMGQGFFVIATLLASSSVVMTGHVSTLPVVVRAILLLHVLGAVLWMGSLYPLQQVCGQVRGADQLAALQTLMRRFGQVAVVIVSVLLPAGLLLAFQLLQTPSDLWTVPYGITLLCKIILVCGLLLLAALNKLVWVPQLSQTGTLLLQRSIRLEMALALLVLALTSWQTTVTGPSAM